MASSDEPHEPHCISPSSEQGGTIAAIGTDVFSFTGPTNTGVKSGTSMATPQVAGLAAYVWALRPNLSPAEAVLLLRRTAQVYPGCGNGLVIDAYAAVLATDEGDPTQPARSAVLDVADGGGNEGRNGAFDERDLDLFLTHIDAPGLSPLDYGRYDLNGDGFTGFSGMPGGSSRIDLDLDGEYGLASADVEGLPVRFDEEVPSDLKALCYIAYSPLYTGDAAARRDRLGLTRCVDLDLEALFPATVEPEVRNLLSVRVSDLDLADAMGEALGQAGMRIELNPSGGAVDQFSGTTNADGVFQTNARLFADQPELTIEVIARVGENGTELGRTTIRAAATVTGGADFIVVSIFGGASPGPFELVIQPTSGPASQVHGSLDMILAVLQAALAGAAHIEQFQVHTGFENAPAASFGVSLPAVDVDELSIIDQACGSTFDVTFRKTAHVIARACRSTIVARFADVVSNGSHLGSMEISGTESAVDVTALGIEASALVGSDLATSSALRVGIHTATVGQAGILGCIDCTFSIDGVVTGSIVARGNANLSLGHLTLGNDAFNLVLQNNGFTAFGGITGGDIVGPAPSRGFVAIEGNSGLALSAIGIGDVSTELIIRNNHGFTNDDARAFANARTVGGAVRIESNQVP